MNRDWLAENFLVPREKQNRQPVPNPGRMAKFMAQFTSIPLRTQLALRLWLANPERYDQYHYYDDVVERIQELLQRPPCVYCGDLLIEPTQNILCAHRAAICKDCLDAYFRWYKFCKPCGRKLVDGTRCTEPTFFRLQLIDPDKVIHTTAEEGCEHGFVFRWKQTMEFRCFAPGCSRLGTLADMVPAPGLLPPDEPIILD